jgi:excisionase family DNA binding protein
MSDLPHLLTVADVADIVGMTDHTIRQAIRDGELPAVKLRGRIRINPADVHAWLDGATITPHGIQPVRGPISLQAPAQTTSATVDNIDALIANGRRRAA